MEEAEAAPCAPAESTDAHETKQGSVPKPPAMPIPGEKFCYVLFLHPFDFDSDDMADNDKATRMLKMIYHFGILTIGYTNDNDAILPDHAGRIDTAVPAKLRPEFGYGSSDWSEFVGTEKGMQLLDFLNREWVPSPRHFSRCSLQFQEMMHACADMCDCDSYKNEEGCDMPFNYSGKWLIFGDEGTVVDGNGGEANWKEMEADSKNQLERLPDAGADAALRAACTRRSLFTSSVDNSFSCDDIFRIDTFFHCFHNGDTWRRTNNIRAMYCCKSPHSTATQVDIYCTCNLCFQMQMLIKQADSDTVHRQFDAPLDFMSMRSTTQKLLSYILLEHFRFEGHDGLVSEVLLQQYLDRELDFSECPMITAYSISCFKWLVYCAKEIQQIGQGSSCMYNSYLPSATAGTDGNGNWWTDVATDNVHRQLASALPVIHSLMKEKEDGVQMDKRLQLTRDIERRQQEDEEKRQRKEEADERRKRRREKRRQRSEWKRNEAQRAAEEGKEGNGEKKGAENADTVQEREVRPTEAELLARREAREALLAERRLRLERQERERHQVRPRGPAHREPKKKERAPPEHRGEEAKQQSIGNCQKHAEEEREKEARRVAEQMRLLELRRTGNAIQHGR